jgi:hypothetical protein
MTELSEADLQAALTNHEEFLAELCRRYSGSEWHHGDEATWYMTGVPAAHFNGAVRASDLQGLEEAVAITVRRFAGRGASFYWYVPPGSPARLGEVLEHGRFIARERDLPLLVASLPAAPPSSPADFEVIRVTDAGGLRAWEQAFYAANGLRSGTGQWVDMFQTTGFGPGSPFRFYLGLAEGQPAATALLFLGQSAGLYAVARPARLRGHGYGAAVAAVALADAASEGQTVAVTHAPSVALKAFAALGFAQVSTLSRFRWTPPDRRRRPRQPQWD